TGLYGVLRERMPPVVESRPADEFLVVVKSQAVPHGDVIEHPAGFVHDFGTDPVAGQDSNLVDFAHGARPKTESPPPQAESHETVAGPHRRLVPRRMTPKEGAMPVIQRIFLPFSDVRRKAFPQ